MNVDLLIVGSGVAGLYLALNTPKDINTLIITKNKPWQCNSFYAQGGIAVAKSIDDIPFHIKDTLEAGSNYNDLKAVSKLIESSWNVIEDLIDKGLEFDTKNGVLNYTKEGGHSTNRILHADGDATGRVVHQFLMEKLNHKILDDVHLIDFLIKDDICYGVEVLRDGKIEHIYAKNTVLASGGVGSLYKYSTNDKSVSGDLQGICTKHNIKLADMEFIQFHPTTYTAYIKRADSKITTKSYLLSEALRGEGALIVDEDGKRFLFDYDERGELAPRDIVSQAIYDYSKRFSKKAFLSFESMSEDFFKNRFPNIYKMLKSFNFNIPYDKIPISPAYHYIMGGVKVGLDAKVDGFLNLYAVGEIACTKVHGANRLASNSLLEALVFAKEVSRNLEYRDLNSPDFEITPKVFLKKNDLQIELRLKELMWEKVGIVRESKSLQEALDEVDGYLSSDIGLFLQYKLLTAKEIIESALSRDESIGAHFIKKG
jgi:L-aspartate oxidase